MMKIVLFSHPAFLGQQSMPRFTNMLFDNLSARGYQVEIYSPKGYFSKLRFGAALKKWLGYIDQFAIFPFIVKRLIKENTDAVYVFTDHALGMWVPMVKDLPNLIICHDFLAQRSAEGEIPQNPTGRSGIVYQRLIRKGYTRADNFVSVSQKTQQDLHRFLDRKPALSKVIYNGLNKKFEPIASNTAREIIGNKIGLNLSNGYILHVGGNQWYKNRVGVVKIYNAWRAKYNNLLPLLLIGVTPSAALKQEISKSAYSDNIYVLDKISDDYISAAYSGAITLLYPSLAEGFGWPIAEAMQAGCPVITTNEAPMTEVGGNAAKYIPVMPNNKEDLNIWLINAAQQLNQIIQLDSLKRNQLINNGFVNAQRFNTISAIDKLEDVIKAVYQLKKH